MGVASSFRKSGEIIDPSSLGPDGGELWVTLKAKTTCKRTRAVKKKKISFVPSEVGHLVGAGSACDLVLEDSNLSSVHARVHLTAEGVMLQTKGRTYYLIGQGVKTTGPHVLEKDQVVKMGACSLQVTGTCVKPRDSAENADALKKFGDKSDDEESPMCYICFDDSSEPGNELVHSPCACAKMVHRSCLSRWITTKGSRLCSICKSKLPIAFTVDAPYLVLQVVRHMRGLHWSGEREYIISFNQRRTNSVTVGSGADCDLCLPDPSLSRCHSRIEFKDGVFRVSDLTSSAGTFLKISESHPLPHNQVSIFKMGRTMLTVKMEIRKKGILARSWRKKKGGEAGTLDSPSVAPADAAVVAAAAGFGVLSPSSIATGTPFGATPAVRSPGAFSNDSDFSPAAESGADSPVVALGDMDSPLADRKSVV